MDSGGIGRRRDQPLGSQQRSCKVQILVYPTNLTIQGALRVAILNILIALIVVMTISWLWTLKAITSEKNSLMPKIIFVLCIIGEFAAIIFGAINDLL